MRDTKPNGPEIKERSSAILQDLLRTSWAPLFSKFEAKLSKLSPLFAKSYVNTSFGGGASDWQNMFQTIAENTPNQLQGLQMAYNFQALKASGPNLFGVGASLELRLEQFRYVVRTEGREVATKLYSEPLLSEEIETITTDILRQTLERIKPNLKTRTLE